MIDAKPIPGSRQVVASFSPGHGSATTTGHHRGRSARRARRSRFRRSESPGRPIFAIPGHFQRDCFMAAAATRSSWSTAQATSQAIYHRLPSGRAANATSPVRSWPRPASGSFRDRTIRSRATGRCCWPMSTRPNMDGVRPGEIKKLLVLEIAAHADQLHRRHGADQLRRHVHAGADPGHGARRGRRLGVHRSARAAQRLLRRARRERPVDQADAEFPDASSPARPFQCVGCHEQRSRNAAGARRTRAGLAPRPAASSPSPACPDVLDYPRDVQPILDRPCVRLPRLREDHRDGRRRASRGDHGPMFRQLLHADRRQPLLRRPQPGTGNYAPRRIGVSASRLLTMLDGSHYGVNATLHASGTAAAVDRLGCGVSRHLRRAGHRHDRRIRDHRPPIRLDTLGPPMAVDKKAAAAVHRRRCTSCHKRRTAAALPQRCGRRGGAWRSGNPPWVDPRPAPAH